MVKFLPLKEAVAENLHDGDTVAFEGFTHLIPTAAAHEAIRQGFRELTLIRMTPDLIYDQMIGMGMAKKVVFSYVGNPGVGLLRRARDAIENGFPHAIEVEEHSHAGMANAYEAGAAGLPCAVFRGYRGAGLAAVNPNIKSVTCPFTGEALAAVPSIRPDVTFIHAQKADRKGNVLVEGIIGIQKEAVLAAKRAVVTVEEVVDNFDDLHPNLTVLPNSCGAAHTPPTRMATTSATMPPISNGTRSPPTASVFRRGCKRTSSKAARTILPAASII